MIQGNVVATGAHSILRAFRAIHLILFESVESLTALDALEIRRLELSPQAQSEFPLNINLRQGRQQAWVGLLDLVFGNRVGSDFKKNLSAGRTHDYHIVEIENTFGGLNRLRFHDRYIRGLRAHDGHRGIISGQLPHLLVHYLETYIRRH